MSFGDLGLPLVVVLFVGAAAVIALAGTRLATVSDKLADTTGFGEALVGAVLLGGATSLSGLVTSVTAAAGGMPTLAVSNAMGGIAAQTVFLVAADVAHRNVNLEHAGASPPGLMQAALLLTLLSLPILGFASPKLELLGVHPASYVLVIAYVFGIRLIARAREQPMWTALRTAETRPDEPDPQNVRHERSSRLAVGFSLLALVLGGCGWLVAQTGGEIVRRTPLGEVAVGALFTALVTSLPELVTTVAAVRRGALTLAIGGILGGNSFDMLFVAVSDMAYRPGPIYDAVGPSQIFLMALTLLMTGLLLLGLLRRQKHGIANVGFESALVLAVYIAGMAILVLYY